MLNIIAEGYRKIIELFYLERNPIHLRLIAKKTGLNENSVHRFLKKLNEEKIVISKKSGNMKLFSLNENKNVYSILTLLDVNRFEQLPDIRKDAIQFYIDSLKKMPIFIILFGSTSRSTFSKESDIDLLVVSNGKIDTTEAKTEADNITAIKINDIQIRYSDFIKELKLKNDKVIQSAILTGYPILNHIKFYEDLKNAKI